MRFKIFIWALVFLLFFPSIYGEENNFNNDEELKELVLKQFPPSTHIQAGQAAGASIKTLMIGITKYWPPDSPESDIYYFYDYYWDGSPERWIGFIVANYSAVLYYMKTTAPNKVGLYALRGKIYGAEELGHNNEVSTNYYIYEVW